MVIHIIAEFMGVRRERIARVTQVREILDDAIDQTNLRPVGSVYHQFEPYGVTGIYLLRESHISIHTWPEHSLVALDIFACGSSKDVIRMFNILKQKFSPHKVEEKMLERYPHEYEQVKRFDVNKFSKTEKNSLGTIK